MAQNLLPFELMTTTLTFNVPEESAELQEALQAGAVRAAIHEFDHALRAVAKHGPLDACPLTQEASVWVRRELREFLDGVPGFWDI